MDRLDLGQRRMMMKGDLETMTAFWERGKGLFAFASFGFDDSGCMMHPRDTQSLTTTYIYGWIHEGGNMNTDNYISICFPCL